MGCYVIPAVAAVIHYISRKKVPRLNTSKQLLLNQLFVGGAIFGIIDHAVNGELLLFSIRDSLLGIGITGTIILAWKIMNIWQNRLPIETTS